MPSKGPSHNNVTISVAHASRRASLPVSRIAGYSLSSRLAGRAPGDGIISLGAQGHALTFGGTSVAAPYVTGANALLCLVELEHNPRNNISMEFAREVYK